MNVSKLRINSKTLRLFQVKIRNANIVANALIIWNEAKAFSAAFSARDKTINPHEVMANCNVATTIKKFLQLNAPQS